ncbi:PepSY domain-containing protein [Streptomyces prasinopilosus]|uniref:Peptidase propeptide and YPEB domain-containing protein n=1 Tax=Streptomyces prasinopilosus TaxID=67344 RepID=A0A1G6WP94_9ACTN|nr:PepSY domain-containing protein [Streptomyces prasinopilosus]SDD67631.1 Peptidase propeptide and YPEB domain-containing protein [Streptomyces prasinopilosus]
MKRNVVIAAITAAALVGGGTATAIAVSGDDEPASTRQVDTWASEGERDDGDDDGDDRDDLDDDARALSADVSAAEAVSAALKHRPGTAVSVEMDDDDDDGEHRGRAAWEVGVLGGGDTRYSVWIDPDSGRVLGSERDDDDDNDAAGVRAALKGTSVTAGEAAKAAAAEGTVTSVDLDDDGPRGEAAWEVETVTAGGDDREWRVGPDNGEVTADDDASDDRGDRGDRDDDGRDDDGDDRDDADDRNDDRDDR